MSESPSGVAILVDIENIKISVALETEIAKIFPGEEIIKIAVGNWQLLKLDLELRERGYQLFHVPTGRDNADREIINLGWLLKSHAKLVIVSNDKIFFQFVHQFNASGKTAYLVYHSKSQAGFAIVNPRVLLYDDMKVFSTKSTTKIHPKTDIDIIKSPKNKENSLEKNIDLSPQFTSPVQLAQALHKIVTQKRTIVSPEALAGEFHKQFSIKASTALIQCKFSGNFTKFINDHQIIIGNNPKEELINSIRELIQSHPQLATDSGKMGHEFKKKFNVSISEKMKQVGISGKCTNLISQVRQQHSFNLN